MSSLGDFGVIHDTPAEEVTFGYFGAMFRVSPDFNDADLLDWLERAATIDESDPKAALLVKDLLRASIHVDDFEQFWALAKANRQTLAERMAVARAVMAQVTGRPTGPPADSSAGQPRTRARSKGGSSSRAIRQLAGRPDLQAFVYQAEAQGVG